VKGRACDANGALAVQHNGRVCRVLVIGPVLPFRGGVAQHTTLLARAIAVQCECHILSFDNLDWGWLREFIQRRINDGGILRLIGKWLNAGIMEGEDISYSDKGTPQGGVITPRTILHN
jgi:hypothetical protein